MSQGPLAGYPIEGVKARLYDGKFHNVDSDQMAFEIAGRMAFRDAARKAKPVIMEPIMEVEVVTPEEYMGDVIGDLNSRRGRIQSMGQRQRCARDQITRAAFCHVWLFNRYAVPDAGSSIVFDAVRPL